MNECASAHRCAQTRKSEEGVEWPLLLLSTFPFDTGLFLYPGFIFSQLD